ncbi:anti-repressor SinI family protein [Gracilibacillus xinjiangensis]|uniref:Anti-repressor SinI family protein n=1 Tax=Gracilibacillus xinjiangensis TaxID=1193282 RepID=A0ABV8WWY6_9BACI
MEKTTQMDYEWIYLILKAKEAGLSAEKIREFLEKEKSTIKEIG